MCSSDLVVPGWAGGGGGGLSPAGCSIMSQRFRHLGVGATGRGESRGKQFKRPVSGFERHGNSNVTLGVRHQTGSSQQGSNKSLLPHRWS